MEQNTSFERLADTLFSISIHLWNGSVITNQEQEAIETMSHSEALEKAFSIVQEMLTLLGEKQ